MTLDLIRKFFAIIVFAFWLAVIVYKFNGANTLFFDIAYKIDFIILAKC